LASGPTETLFHRLEGLLLLVQWPGHEAGDSAPSSGELEL
jgi:hypothetical protein